MQGYGLPETTGICTSMTHIPVEPGHFGQPLAGIEMALRETRKFSVRETDLCRRLTGIRPEETAKVGSRRLVSHGRSRRIQLRGHWRIIGRIKNLIHSEFRPQHRVPEPD